MKISHIIIFILIVLSVYGSVNYYIFLRGWQAIPKISLYKTAYVIIFLLLSLSFFAGRILERYTISAASNIFIWSGSLWLGLMAYLFLSVLLIDILRASNFFFNFFPDFIYANYGKTKLIIAAGTLALSVLIVVAGFINECIPNIKKIELTIPKKAGNIKSLHIAMASDIHMGTIISNSRLEKLVSTINDLKPDIVLLPGDIVDEDLRPVIKNNLGDILKTFKSKYGTYAITGNHEYIGGAEAAVKYLTAHNINMLRDSAVKINGSFYIVGREDRSIKQFSGLERKDLKIIIKDIDCRLPVILMDHQPFSLHKTAESCVDLQLSGHTHHGQLWPFNFITSMIYEISHGYKKIENTNFYVSSGYGTWGPPIRTSSRSEIVDIILHFKN